MPDGAFAYVANRMTSDVSVISTATNTVVATVGVDFSPFGIAITPDGTLVYVANGGGEVSVIASATNTVVANFTLGFFASFMAITPDGTLVYVANRGSGEVSVISTATNTVVATINVGTNPVDVVIKP
jgi:YVTN family beta-propeller protein